MNSEENDIKQEEQKHIFQLFDKDNNGYINISDLPIIIRGLGYNISEKKMHDLINIYDTNGSNTIDFPTFYKNY